ncbi:MAG: hypothetical protein Q8K98_10255 [Bacteroidota bacterium]|nr:hypothetical protein [Bacteroidota bacterium]
MLNIFSIIDDAFFDWRYRCMVSPLDHPARHLSGRRASLSRQTGRVEPHGNAR